MSAPHVAGAIALLFQLNAELEGEGGAQLTAEQTRSILTAAANPPAGVTPFDTAWGFGRLDVRRAVELLQQS